jgi:hypothetical protein
MAAKAASISASVLAFRTASFIPFARRFLRGSDVLLGHLILRVHQQGDHGSLGNQLAKHLELLGLQLDGEVAEAGEVAARLGETGD